MTIIIENKDSIRTIVLNRPEKLNSVNLEMAIELNQAVKNAANHKLPAPAKSIPNLYPAIYIEDIGP